MKNKYIIKAIKNNDIKEIKNFIDSGFIYNPINEDLDLMYYSIEESNLDMVKYLFENGYNVRRKVRNLGYDTPLDYACLLGEFDIVKFLIEADKNVLVDNDSLNLATSKGYADIVNLLINKGINVNQKDSDSCNPLHWAAQEGYLKIAKVLIENGCNLNELNKCGLTPLYTAASENRFELVKYFVEHGAIVDLSLSESPFQIAVSRKYYKIAKYLLENGADVNFIADDGVSALFWAVLKNDNKMISFLKEHGAKEDLDNYYGVTIKDLDDTKIKKKVYNEFF